jgi:hypothetical protein
MFTLRPILLAENNPHDVELTQAFTYEPLLFRQVA